MAVSIEKGTVRRRGTEKAVRLGKGTAKRRGTEKAARLGNGTARHRGTEKAARLGNARAALAGAENNKSAWPIADKLATSGGPKATDPSDLKIKSSVT
jgi:hypothetical protein